MLQPNEKIDMPVFFFIDPSFLDDRKMDLVDSITLSYTFFKAGEADAPGINTPSLFLHGTTSLAS
jgi:cytochrome c oxidase assembly protein subunit 11